MTNEILLAVSLVVLYGTVLLWFYLFGTGGMMAFTVFATIAANIEVMILVDAFGMEMTLGNILFATTFLVTDILSEVAGKKTALEHLNSHPEFALILVDNQKNVYLSDSLKNSFTLTEGLGFKLAEGN